MKRFACFLTAAILAGGLLAAPVSPRTITPHLLSFQGRALDTAGNVVRTGDLRVRVYTAAVGDTLVYDSGTDFAGAIENGHFDVLLGDATPLQLDNTRLYYLEVDVNGEEVAGDATGGRQAFYPGGGSHARSDLEQRLDALESVVFFSCDPGTFDLNQNPGDGCEFTLDPDGIYVSGSDPSATDIGACGLGPVGTGASNFPCATIARGIERAVELGRSTVYVADANYVETVTLVNGIGLRGGYRADTWERHVATTNTVIRGNTVSGHKKTVIAQGLVSTTVVEGFVIHGQDNSASGGNSYAVYVRDSSGLQLLDNLVYAGDGGDGNGGSTGGGGASGIGGSAGADATDTSYDCYEQCNGAGGGNVGGAGGTLFCGPTNISGGDGADASCPDYDETTILCSACPTGAVQTVFDNGANGANGSASGGTGGWDAVIDAVCFGNCNCVLPSGTMAGGDGQDGSDGGNGNGGSGGSIPGGTVAGFEWLGAGGTPGTDGTPGGGGGGGGAGGGVETSSNVSCSTSGASDLGGSGGGGGSGGCGGGGGGAGAAGGGSFAIFVVFSSPPGAIPVISGNTVQRGNGGRGGPGGYGGIGGLGGAGAPGGAGGSSAADFCAAAGGAGGDGGDGGHGGGGGGGCGGVSYGIFASGQGGANLSSWSAGNTFSGGGSGGVAGAGGGSAGLPGGAGVSGASGDTNF
jgi:hypothetical protein